jgi:alpha-galactosidase
MIGARLANLERGYALSTAAIRVVVDDKLRLTPSVFIDGEERCLCAGSEGSTATVVVDGQVVPEFVAEAPPKLEPAASCFGEGTRVCFTGRAELPNGIRLRQDLLLEFWARYPNTVVVRPVFTVEAGQAEIEKVIGLRFVLDSTLAGGQTGHDFWSFNGGSEIRRRYIVPVDADFDRDNGQGMSGGGFGGGIPVADVWGPAGGLAVGHVDTTYRIMRIPLKTLEDGRVSLSLEWEPREVGLSLAAGRLEPLPLMLSAHPGDYFDPLRDYSSLLRDQGIEIPCEADGEAHEPAWCSWGYHETCTPDDIRSVLPVLKRLGIRWVTIDDGWFNATGDWEPRESFYPGTDLKDFVRDLHEQGFKVQIWTIPGEADGDPDIDTWLSKYPEGAIERWKHKRHELSDVFRDHPDWFVRDEAGDLVFGKRGNHFFCPSLAETVEYHRAFTERLIVEYDFDGFKQDAVYTCPPCHCPDHPHHRPEEAGEKFHEFLKVIYETAKRLKPEAVVQTCPCGVAPTFAWLAYQNQPVTADPRGSDETRLNTKMFKALVGPNAPVFADHVECTDDSCDFASQIGVGSVLNTRVNLLGHDQAKVLEGEDFQKIPWNEEKEALWKKWFDLTRGMQLSKGMYQNLYTTGYDVPEGHAIARGGKMYYAFFADEFSGTLELRGLEPGREYTAFDYENDVELGTVLGPVGGLKVSFKRHLLLECTPRAAKEAGR